VGESTLTTINAASSNEPQLLGAYRAVTDIAAITRRGETVWLAGQGSGATAFALTIGPDGTWAESASLGSAGGGRALGWSAAGDPLLLTDSGAIYQLGISGAGRLRAGLLSGAALASGPDDQLLIGGQGWAGLTLTDPARPQVVAEGSAALPVVDLVVDGDRVVLATGDAGLQLAGDAAVRWQPRSTDGVIRSLAVTDAALIAAEAGPDDRGAARIFTRDRLAAIAAVPLAAPATAITAQGACALVGYGTDGQGGVAVVDAAAPTAGLTAAGTLPVPAQAVARLPDETLAYAVSGSRLTVIDLAGWPDLAVGGTVDLPVAVEQLALFGVDRRYLAALAPDESLLLLDLADPRLPRVVALVPADGVKALNGVAGDDQLLLCGGRGIRAARPATFLQAGGVFQPEVVQAESCAALLRVNGTVYAAVNDQLVVLVGEGPSITLPGNNVPVAGLAARVTRRDGVWVYGVVGEQLLAVHHRPDGTLAPPVTLLTEGVAGIFGADDTRLYVQHTDGLLHVAGLPDRRRWTGSLRFPGRSELRRRCWRMTGCWSGCPIRWRATCGRRRDYARPRCWQCWTACPLRRMIWQWGRNRASMR
jgi:hypothetical protein